jgi:hypothetical protein
MNNSSDIFVIDKPSLQSEDISDLRTYEYCEEDILEEIIKLSERIKYPTIISLLLKFQTDKANFSKFIEGKESEVTMLFYKVTKQLLILEPTKITVTITSTSLYFSMLFQHKIKINYEVLFDKTDDGVEVIFTAYENGERIATYMGTMSEMLNELTTIIYSGEYDDSTNEIKKESCV